MKKRLRLLLRVVIPVALVGLGVLAAAAVFRMAPSAARAEPARQRPLVEVVEVTPATATVRIGATGMVIAAREVTILPEVSGRIVERADDLVPGGRLVAGELIARIDSRDYRLAINQERARVSTAEVQLETERARRQVAEREWDLFGDGRPREEVPLALRRPQLRAARANVEAAQSALARARLALARTELRAPWNAVVIEARAEVGQVVGPQTRVATLVGTDQVWVRVALPVGQLAHLALPGVNAPGDRGSTALVHQELSGGQTVEWQGEVIRLEGRLEPETRTAQLLIAVDAPFDVADSSLPLLPGTFAEVTIEGRSADNVYDLPRSALQAGAMVWALDDSDRLVRRPVEVGWGSDQRVFVTDGLEPGDRVVTSALSLPVKGEPVRVSQRRVARADEATGDGPAI